MAVYLCPVSAIFQFFNDVGIVLSGGKINTYVAGTTTPQASYTDSTGVTPNSNPIILGSNGRLQNVQIWQPGGVAIKIVVTDSNNNVLGQTFDQITGIGDPGPFLGTFWGGVATNSFSAYMLMFASNFTALSNGITVYWIVGGATNLGPATLSVNGLPFISVLNPDGSALNAGSLRQGAIVQTIYQNGAWYVLNSTIASMSFTGQLTGFAANQNVTMQYSRNGDLVSLWCSSGATAASTSTSMALLGLPAIITPTSSKGASCPAYTVLDNSVFGAAPYDANVLNNGTVQLYKGGSSSGFTAAGNKGVAGGFQINYSLK
jgi:hypothetical protein